MDVRAPAPESKLEVVDRHGVAQQKFYLDTSAAVTGSPQSLRGETLRGFGGRSCKAAGGWRGRFV